MCEYSCVRVGLCVCSVCFFLVNSLARLLLMFAHRALAYSYCAPISYNPNTNSKSVLAFLPNRLLAATAALQMDTRKFNDSYIRARPLSL
jgi:hypothetical protein